MWRPDRPDRGLREWCPLMQRSMAQSSSDISNLLVRIAQNADRLAFEELHTALAPRLKSYMLRQGARPDVAEDLAQEAMMRVWQKAHLYDAEKGSATTWIYTIARNLRIDKIRREYVWQEMPDGLDEVADETPTPEEQVSLDQRSIRVRQALTVLPPDQAEVIQLSFIDGLSHSEISDKIDVPLGTVKSRMRLAYAKLQEQLQFLR
jgi:RNA polymerase sigma-70 factor (ECF subfamily)